MECPEKIPKNNKSFSQMSFAEILKSKGEKITDRPRYLHELADYWNEDVRTLKKELNCEQLKHILPKIKNLRKYRISIKHIQEIINHIGEPE